jgi:hypothetical protein
VPHRERRPEVPGERTHNRERAIPVVTVYDPDEDYTQPTIDLDAVTKYLENRDLFEAWLVEHPQAA